MRNLSKVIFLLLVDVLNPRRSELDSPHFVEDNDLDFRFSIHYELARCFFIVIHCIDISIVMYLIIYSCCIIWFIPIYASYQCKKRQYVYTLSHLKDDCDVSAYSGGKRPTPVRATCVFSHTYKKGLTHKGWTCLAACILGFARWRSFTVELGMR